MAEQQTAWQERILTSSVVPRAIESGFQEVEQLTLMLLRMVWFMPTWGAVNLSCCSYTGAFCEEVLEEEFHIHLKLWEAIFPQAGNTDTVGCCVKNLAEFAFNGSQHANRASQGGLACASSLKTRSQKVKRYWSVCFWRKSVYRSAAEESMVRYLHIRHFARISLPFPAHGMHQRMKEKCFKSCWTSYWI